MRQAHPRNNHPNANPHSQASPEAVSQQTHASNRRGATDGPGRNEATARLEAESELQAEAESKPVPGTAAAPPVDQHAIPVRPQTKSRDPADSAAQTGWPCP
jgi:hypothetical protein